MPVMTYRHFYTRDTEAATVVEWRMSTLEDGKYVALSQPKAIVTEKDGKRVVCYTRHPDDTDLDESMCEYRLMSLEECKDLFDDTLEEGELLLYEVVHEAGKPMKFFLTKCMPTET